MLPGVPVHLCEVEGEPGVGFLQGYLVVILPRQ